jgi:hypothetical protein
MNGNRLTKKALLEAIRDLPDDSPIVIGGELMRGVRIEKGRINAESGYFNERFGRTPKGKTLAIMFTRRSENSEGIVSDDHIA